MKNITITVYLIEVPSDEIYNPQHDTTSDGLVQGDQMLSIMDKDGNEYGYPYNNIERCIIKQRN